jgi:hypothetical protein
MKSATLEAANTLRIKIDSTQELLKQIQGAKERCEMISWTGINGELIMQRLPADKYIKISDELVHDVLIFLEKDAIKKLTALQKAFEEL